MRMAKALTIKEFGPPAEVLMLEEKPVPDPGGGEVLLRVLAAAIHPSDLGIVLGKYGTLPELPAVAGREGVAEVVALGDGVEGLQEGDRVRVPADAGAWQSEMVVPAGDLLKLPSDIPVELSAMATINPPTAWRLLRDAHLNEGEWVVQNAANSAVGLHVIEMARHLGLKTLNIVRREELVEPLLGRGADVVMLEESGYEKQVAEITSGEPVRLALNSIGGDSAVRLVRSLSRGGIHVTFGAMQFDKVRFPTRELIFNDITLRGFWMDQWYREQSKARVQIMFDKIFDLMRKEVVVPSVHRMYPLDEYKEALAAAARPRLGKILFKTSA